MKRLPAGRARVSDYNPAMEPWSSEPRAAVDAALRERRTIHQFHSEVPDDALLTEALELACWAPNHRSTEPWRYYMRGPETVRAVVDLNARLVAQSRSSAPTP